MRSFNRGRSAYVLATLVPAVTIGVVSLVAQAQVPTTLNDFFQPGTQPNTLVDDFIPKEICGLCHGGYNVNEEPYDRWVHSMMGQAARDPVFYACLAIANQDVANVGDLCIRCHAPVAWLEGRSTPVDGSGFQPKDFDGVACHFCHRLVDPVASPANPVEDGAILAALGQVPTNPHSGQYIVDPVDNRRGPFDLDPNFPFHEWRNSPFHTESLLCANCHDVSNPAYTRAVDGSYDLGPLNQPHPTHNKTDEFPIERTYSEWASSAFAQGPVEMGGRFGGNITAVSSCQDCHMPKTSGTACQPGLGGIFRNNLPLHDFNGANTWVLDAIWALYSEESGMTTQGIADAKSRTRAMLEAASDLEVVQLGGQIRARVINQTGHKLPTGYPEGRRMWVNVRFLDQQDTLIDERGAYDSGAAELEIADTKVYEAHLGLDEEVAAATGLPAGVGFHFALNNKWFQDNRIPPRGFTNAGFAAVQAAPVGYSYADGQYWDDTQYQIPMGARRAEVRVYFQTTTKEYVEFLRDANTNTVINLGQVAYDQWVAQGKSAPALLDEVLLPLSLPGDLDDDDDVDLTDLALLLSNYGGVGGGGDVDLDGDTDLTDLAILLANFGTSW